MEKIKYVSNDELQLPEIVYKYRDWNNLYHKTIITERDLYFASPRDFEDPKDCKNLIDYGLLTDDEIYNRYLAHSERYYPEWNIERKHEYAQYWFNQGLLRNQEHIQLTNELYENKFFDCFGVFSVTENYKNPRMWNKYANRKTGFCVGFDTRSLVDTIPILGAGHICYFEELPKIHPFEDNLISYIKQIHYKEVKWEFELEYRLRKRWEDEVIQQERIIKYHPDAVKHVVFGAKISSETKNEIKSIAARKFKNVEFTQMIEKRN